MKKKLLSLLMILSLTIAFYVPSKPAFASVANPVLSAPGGSAAAAQYIIGGMLVASGAAALTQVTNGAQVVRQKAVQIYNSMTNAEQQLYTNAVNATVSGTTSAVKVTSDMITAIQNHLNSMSTAAQISDSQAEVGANFYTNYQSNTLVEIDASPNTTYTWSDGLTTGAWCTWALNSNANSDGTYYLTVTVHGGKTYSGNISSTLRNLIVNTTNNDWLKLAYCESAAGAIGANVTLQKISGSAVPSINSFNTYANNTVGWVQNGLNEIDIPLDQFLAKDTYGHNLTINSDGSLANADGTTFTGQNTWSFPVPVPDSTALPNVQVGNPSVALDHVVVGSDPFATDGTTTGTTTGSTTGTGTATATDLSVPTDDPANTSNKFGQLITTKFPFSLPWDIKYLLGLLYATPTKPAIHVDQTFTFLGYSAPFKFDVNFDAFDPYVSFFRWFILIGYFIFLVLSTRKLLGGGQ